MATVDLISIITNSEKYQILWISEFFECLISMMPIFQDAWSCQNLMSRPGCRQWKNSNNSYLKLLHTRLPFTLVVSANWSGGREASFSSQDMDCELRGWGGPGYGSGSLTSILSWDPLTESWQAAGDLKVARNDHAVVTIPSSIIESECSVYNATLEAL